MNKINLPARIADLFQAAQRFYDNGDPSHDLTHIRRVMETCLSLAQSEGADIETVLAAAILHDIVNLPKNHPEREKASQMAAEKARRSLKDAGFSEKEISRITTVIEEHSYSLGRKPSSIESAILQDADKLDALGAIGIMRTVTCGCRMGAAYYDIADPLAESRPLDDRAFTADHFPNKLFKLPELMNTTAARAEAEYRVTFMRRFLDQLWRETGIPKTDQVLRN